MPSIFISYRRNDTDKLAIVLSRDLKDDLGIDQVFLDRHDLWGNDQWQSTLEQRIDTADVVLVLAGDAWAGPDGQRIMADDDLVRWEVRRVLQTGRPHVLVLVDDAELPDQLPPDLEQLTGAQHVRLSRVARTLEYEELLGYLFYATVRLTGDVVVVTDGTDEAEAHLLKLAEMLKGGELGDEARNVVRAATQGFACLALGDAAALWPEVIVLRDPERANAVLDARVRGIRRRTASVALIASTTTAITAFVAGQALAVGPTPVTPSPSPSPVHFSTNATRPGWRATWRSLNRLVKAGLVASGAVAALVVALLLIPDPPIDLTGSWDVTAFDFQPDAEGATNSASLDGGRMVFEPAADCAETPCALAVTEGPSLLVDVLVEPVGNGSEYVGQGANVSPFCGGQMAPTDLTESTLSARHGSGDTLEFVITTALVESWGGCDPFMVHYVATATRAT